MRFQLWICSVISGGCGYVALTVEDGDPDLEDPRCENCQRPMQSQGAGQAGPGDVVYIKPPLTIHLKDDGG